MEDESMSYLEALQKIKRLEEAIRKIRERVQYASTMSGCIYLSKRELLEIIDKNTEGLL